MNNLAGVVYAVSGAAEIGYGVGLIIDLGRCAAYALRFGF